MLIYHRTHAVEAIFRDGFHDPTGRCLTPDDSRRVWVADRPLDSAFTSRLLEKNR